jgi:hypothetical protein
MHILRDLPPASRYQLFQSRLGAGLILLAALRATDADGSYDVVAAGDQQPTGIFAYYSFTWNSAPNQLGSPIPS